LQVKLKSKLIIYVEAPTCGGPCADLQRTHLNPALGYIFHE